MYLPPSLPRPGWTVAPHHPRAPLGRLVSQGPEGLDANHLPWLLDPEAGDPAAGGVLLAHVARANPLWRELSEGAPVLVLFGGPQAYISPNWYPGKQETHRRVPTWNYEVVHAHGRLYVHDDEKFLRGLLARLTRQHEASQPRPWKMGEARPTTWPNSWPYRGHRVAHHAAGGQAQAQPAPCGTRPRRRDRRPAGPGQHALARAMQAAEPWKP
jgi:transcriptional regulator